MWSRILLAVLVGCSLFTANAVVGSEEEKAIHAWVDRTLNTGFNKSIHYCEWRGFECNAEDYVESITISPTVQIRAIMMGDLPDIPAWLDLREDGEAFLNLTNVQIISYKFGPFLPDWFFDHFQNLNSFNFTVDTTLSLVCYDDPCPLQKTTALPCAIDEDTAIDLNLTCSNANIISRTPMVGPSAGGNRVVISINIPLGFLDVRVSFGHTDGQSVPVPITELYLVSVNFVEWNNTNLSQPGANVTLQYFTSVIVAAAPPHTPGPVALHLFAGSTKFTKAFDMLYYYECPKGTFQPDDGSYICVPCQPGYYNDVYGAAECKPCAAGSYSDVESAEVCDLCPPGTYSNATAADSESTCIPCEPGTANPLWGQTECADCLVGYSQPNYGQIECIACLPGYFNDVSGSANCTACNPGSYQPDSQSSFCLFCPVATYAPDYASTLCYPCDVGETTSGRGSSSCNVICPPGYYRPQSSPRCLACAPGKYTAEAGLAICSLCNSTTYNTQWNSTECYVCPEQSTNYRGGSTTCEPLLVKQTQDDNMLLILGILLVIVAVVVLICGISYVVYRRRVQQQKKRELEKLKELMQLAPSQ